MMIGFVLVAVVVVAAIFLINGYQNKFQSFHGTIFNAVVITLLLFLFLTVAYVYNKSSSSLDSFSDLKLFVKVYFSWIGNFLSNVRGIGGYVIKQDWGGFNTTDFNFSGK